MRLGLRRAAYGEPDAGALHNMREAAGSLTKWTDEGGIRTTNPCGWSDTAFASSGIASPLAIPDLRRRERPARDGS
jgi:hypothetical protein